MNFATATRAFQFDVLGVRLRVVAILLGALLLVPAVAHARPLPEPEEIALPEERDVLAELAKVLGNGNALPQDCMARLDRTLARLGRPTPLRGYVQILRARCFDQFGKSLDAHEALKESIFLLPNYSAPLLYASSLYNYSDEPGKSADLLLRAIDLDPETVRKMPAYELGGLLRRLGEQDELERRASLSERLIAIGWMEGGVSRLSDLAEWALEARLDRGDVEGARALVTKLFDPADAYRLLSLRKFEPLWPDIERWGGDKLENLWPLYLNETRSAWRASRDPAIAADYAYALRAAGHERAIIREFMPLLLKPIEPRRDYQMIFAVSVVADSLAREGRWDEVEQLFAHTQRFWPMGLDANALNLAANRARLLIAKGDMELGLAAMNAALADAARWKGHVNSGALGTMHRYRACALHALGRDEDAISSRSIVLSDRNDTSSIVSLHLCMNERDAARDVMLRSFAVRDSASAAAALMQPASLPPFSSDYGRAVAARDDELKTDPALLAALDGHGRVMPYALSAGAPPETE